MRISRPGELSNIRYIHVPKLTGRFQSSRQSFCVRRGVWGHGPQSSWSTGHVTRLAARCASTPETSADAKAPTRASRCSKHCCSPASQKSSLSDPAAILVASSTMFVIVRFADSAGPIWRDPFSEGQPGFGGPKRTMAATHRAVPLQSCPPFTMLIVSDCWRRSQCDGHCNTSPAKPEGLAEGSLVPAPYRGALDPLGRLTKHFTCQKDHSARNRRGTSTVYD